MSQIKKNKTNKNFSTYNLLILDKRTRGWLLVDTPWPTLLSTVVYLAIVWYGPKFMRDRKPFRLTWALIPYNLAMAALNAFIAFEVKKYFVKLQ
jgi:elongation of very long chain fatty acids protein 4